MSQQFEWDAKKAADNLKKPRLGFDEALTVFADPLARIFDDPNHSAEEKREIIIGHSASQRLLVVGFTSGTTGFGSSRRARRPRGNARRMKKTRRSTNGSDDLRPEYDFSYAQARPNRFASRMRGPVVAVVLEPDVAEVFHSSEAVNRILRSVISALPKRGRGKTMEKSRRKAG